MPSVVCLHRVTSEATSGVIFGPKAMFPESINQSRAAGATQVSASSDGPASSLAAVVRAVAAQTNAGTDVAALIAALAETGFQSPCDLDGLAVTEAQSIIPPLKACAVGSVEKLLEHCHNFTRRQRSREADVPQESYRKQEGQVETVPPRQVAARRRRRRTPARAPAHWHCSCFVAPGALK